KVRCGVITRQQALDALATPPFFETDEMVNYCLEKQGLTRQEYEAILRGPNRYFTDFPSWYPLLKACRLPIRLLCRLHLLPAHAYEKFFETV
ncbi:MAG TPA: N-acetyl sugar amidotransferase, partial [Candidatus Hydrogenedentes bacterium]|nr:N-acetyl sugar amidotransferase [Candidatus Hydrogenedentota bacterium]